MHLLITCLIAIAGLVVVESSLEPRIVGGANTTIDKFPFYASVRKTTNKYIGGAVIIGRFWVVTAAQCVEGRAKQDLMVVTGTDSLNEGGQRYAIESVHFHPNFDRFTKSNDIALLKLIAEVKFTKTVASVALATKAPSIGKKLQVCGHGATATPYLDRSVKLKFIETRSISTSQCAEKLHVTVDGSRLCAVSESSSGACVGDFGSPLISRGGIAGPTKLHGILSWDSSCGKDGRPGVYTSIVAVRSWILSVTRLVN
ncbi:trypsin alpha-3-like [Photinus pyralis]|uniref:trypsin alpha-3-like n=1 Tax=Photinus pyralis TaxID=7054 RepID=UPI0012671C9E|nr:trypsin alpha-3-like [Photinus pyralis]